MSFIKVDQENSQEVRLYVEDHGDGEPVILVHGWPLNGGSFEKQTIALLKAGYRVITDDRRGFGYSSKPTFGYDYDTFASDLNQIVTHLGLESFSLFGFSMGGGEVARYIGRFGASKLKSVGFLGAITPFLVKTANNPTGVEKAVLSDIAEGLEKDRFAFLKMFFENFYNTDVFLGKRISSEALQHSWIIATSASPTGTIDCVTAWQEDFRADIKNLKIPTLIVHGTEDRIVPIQASAEVLAKLIPTARFEKLEGAPHGFLLTHAEEVSVLLLKFLSEHHPSQPALERRTETRSESRAGIQ